MRRPYPYITLGALALPAAIHGGSLGGNNRKKMHFAGHFAGLGDGNIDTATAQQGLRGAGNKRKRIGGRKRETKSGQEDDHHLQPTAFVRDDAKDSLRNDFRRAASTTGDRLDDIELMDYLRKSGGIRPALMRRVDPTGGDAMPAQTLASDGPWQLSVLVLLGIVGVLMGLFVHFSTDSASPPPAPYFRRRIPKKKPHHFHSSPSYKKTDAKKPDYWSEDEGEGVMTEDDVNYSGDTEGSVGGQISIAKKRNSPMPKAPDDPTARLYYQLNSSDSFRQQESRLRKSATSTTTQQQQQQSSSNMGRTRPESTVPAFHSPSRSKTRSSTISGNGGRKVDKASSSPFPTPPYPRSSTPSGNASRRISVEKTNSKPFPSPPFQADISGIGSGLEGFEHHPDSVSGAETINIKNNVPAFKASPLVKPMGTFTPTESFASISSSIGENVCVNSVNSASKITSDGDLSTPPLSLEDESTNSFLSESPSRQSPRQFGDHSFLPVSSPRQSGDYSSQYSGNLSELPTPRVDHTRANLARALEEQADNIGNLPLSFTSTVDASEGPSAYVENANFPSTETDPADIAGAFPGLPLVPNLNATGDSSSSFHIDAPRSLALEELQLVRMESGVPGPKWRTELDHHATRTEEQRQKSENEEKLREASAAVDPGDDPRNSIQHIRKDLTISSDASSSLSSKITFSELKLGGVIGGGGFGQVWRARWKGTPVAVKVLTGSAQAELVPKAVLEEFIAEINMLSGMRHPNVCLFMGACLEPPNRAIVTELCENGSLWDALRSPLSAYGVADGKTRLAWPLKIYEPMTSAPPTLHSIEPPLVPGGAWPWILVKRVAAGTARGMCYLHSGNPPVLHRDLKSANILLDESYTAKLADFGLSRLKAVRSGMTGNCGTVQWMAPEVLSNEEYAEPADVFSYGIILWEMLTKECPYDGMSPIQCALSVLNENNRPEIPEWCPQSLRALIRNCVEKNPSSRPTFTQILAALDALP